MRNLFVALCALWLVPLASAFGAEQQHSLWSLEGKTNTVYLLGSVHFLSESEQLPAALDAAYEDAEVLLMEIDMDDLDPLETQQIIMELGMLPPGETLQQHLDKATHARLTERARQVGLDPALLDRFRPWFAAITLVQLQLMKLGLAPTSGIEQRFTTRAVADSKPIHGLETLREQLGMLAGLPDRQQHEFLLYSIEDADRMAEELEQLLSAWRRGDSKALADLLAEGFEQYPDLYRPLTTERNRRWLERIEALLDDPENYLVVVGTLHLVGKDSLIELLEARGHEVTQH